VHGIIDAAVATSSPTTPGSTHTNGTVELLHAPHGIGGSLTNETPSGRVYCPEYECGRGFSSKEHLESHMRFFHSKRIVDMGGSSSTAVVQGFVGQPPEYPPSTSVTPPHEVERVTQGNHAPHPSVGTCALSLSVAERQEINSQGVNAGTRPEAPIQSSLSTHGDVNVRSESKSPATNILSLHCRMCDAPPTATTQPTVTTCGHLFCSECITGHVVSTSRCPVCNSTLLLYCLFKLDLLVKS